MKAIVAAHVAELRTLLATHEETIGSLHAMAEKLTADTADVVEPDRCDIRAGYWLDALAVVLAPAPARRAEAPPTPDLRARAA